MIERRVVDRTSEGGVGTGMVLGAILILLVVATALFFLFGGPSRISTGTTSPPNQTNVNVPQSQPQTQPQSGPNINVPPRLDVNVNQNPSGGAPAPAQQAPQQPAQPAGNR